MSELLANSLTALITDVVTRGEVTTLDELLGTFPHCTVGELMEALDRAKMKVQNGRIVPEDTAEELLPGAFVLARAPYPNPAEAHIGIVLCELRDGGRERYVTWVENRKTRATVWGHYFEDAPSAWKDYYRRIGEQIDRLRDSDTGHDGRAC